MNSPKLAISVTIYILETMFLAWGALIESMEAGLLGPTALALRGHKTQILAFYMSYESLIPAT